NSFCVTGIRLDLELSDTVEFPDSIASFSSIWKPWAFDLDGFVFGYLKEFKSRWRLLERLERSTKYRYWCNEGVWSTWSEYLQDPQLSKLANLAQKVKAHIKEILTSYVKQAMDEKEERLKCLQREACLVKCVKRQHRLTTILTEDIQKSFRISRKEGMLLY
ncbi:hypothetical protein Tco_0960837, partial [Tanacetum coccineum]